MNCTDFERHLNDLFGAAGLPNTAETPSHAAECPRCRETWERFRLLHEATDLWRKQTPEVDLSRAVVNSLGSRPSSLEPVDEIDPRSSRSAARDVRARPRAAETAPIAARGVLQEGFSLPRRTLLAALAAAALLFALGLAWQSWRDEPAGAEMALKADPIADPAPRELDLRRAGLPAEPELPDPAPYRDLVQQATGALGDVTAFVMPGSNGGLPRAGEARTSADWIDGLQHQLRPIGRSLEDAFDFLWQAGESADRTRT